MAGRSFPGWAPRRQISSELPHFITFHFGPLQENSPSLPRVPSSTRQPPWALLYTPGDWSDLPYWLWPCASQLKSIVVQYRNSKWTFKNNLKCSQHVRACVQYPQTPAFPQNQNNNKNWSNKNLWHVRRKLVRHNGQILSLKRRRAPEMKWVTECYITALSALESQL